MEEKEEGMTLGEVWQVLKHRIWYILGATVLFTVAAVLLLEFVVNPLRATYSMKFDLVFPTEEDVYPDGSPFFYQDIVSSKFLSEAKGSGNFSNVNTEKMLKNGDIEIEPDSVVVEGITEYTGSYSVTVQAAYFRSEDQAEEFIKALAQVSVETVREEAKMVDYASDKNVFGSAPFEERLSMLSSERATILSTYDKWIDIYSETYSVRITGENGPVVRRLKDFRDSAAALFGESVKSGLEDELEFGGYFAGDLGEYTARLKREYQQNEAEIARIKEILSVSPVSLALNGAETSPIAGTDLSQRLAELINRNNRIDHWVNASGEVSSPTLTEENVEAFAARLDEEFDKLNTEASLLTDVIAAIYGRGMSVRFDSQKVTSSGDIGTIVGALVCFLGGLIAASVIVYFIDTNKKKTEQAPTEEGPEEEGPKDEGETP